MLEAVRLDCWDEALIELARTDAKAEIVANSRSAELMAKATLELWLVKDDDEPIALFGMVPRSLIAREAYVWLIPFEGFSRRHVRGCQWLFDKWAATYSKTVIHCFTETSARFARFYGFRPTDSELYERVN